MLDIVIYNSMVLDGYCSERARKTSIGEGSVGVEMVKQGDRRGKLQ